MAQFALLDQAAEDKLHSTRLLNIEERPFKRITKRLLAPSNPIVSYLSRTPVNPSRPAPPSSASTPPVVTTTTTTTTTTIHNGEQDPPQPSSPTTLTPAQHTQYLTTLSRLREDTLLDFSSFDSSLARTQVLHRANQNQRARYTAEKISIQSTSASVRTDMERLKQRLEEAQRTLQTRKGYDVLAERITRDKDLKSREEQAVGIERLRNEIEELEREGVELAAAWAERRERFKRVVEEGDRVRRVVRGEPEPEARGDEEDGSDGDDDGDRDGDEEEEGRSDGDGEGGRDGDGDEDENMLGHDGQGRDHDANSNMGTPMLRPATDGEDAPTPLPRDAHESDVMTPRSTVADAEISTPRLPEDKVAATQGDDVDMAEGVPDVRIDDMDTT